LTSWMKLGKNTKLILQYLGNYLLFYAAVVLCKSLRVRTKNFENLKSLLDTDNLVIAFWHGTMIIPWFYFRKHKMSALVSGSKDGELLFRVLNKWKYNVQRGSSSKGGKDALQKLIDLAAEKYSLAITPDGPGGPVFKMKPGAVIVSKKSQIPLVMVGIGIDKKWTLKSWDSFEVPKFFSRINMVASNPITISNALTYDETSEKILECEKILNQLQAEASVFA
jgi:lysophospholipid acyltransferase (LPLAT)-like uncharacterized protein